MKTIDNELSMGRSVGQSICKKCESVSKNYIYAKTIQKSQEWFPHGKDEEMRFDYLNIDKDGKFSVAYTIRKKNENCSD